MNVNMIYIKGRNHGPNKPFYRSLPSKESKNTFRTLESFLLKVWERMKTANTIKFWAFPEVAVSCLWITTNL